MARKRDPKAQRRYERKRASLIRKKVAEGRATEEEIALLADYDATKQPTGRPLKDDGAPDADDDADDDTADESPEPVEPAIEAAPAATPPLPKIPLPPPPKLSAPPRVRVEADDAHAPPSGKGADWRAKYRAGPTGGSREVTVTKIAEQWRNVLLALCEGMKAANVEPLVNPHELYPSMVLLVDEVLPAHVEITPKVIALGGTTALVVQRFIRRKEIAEAQMKEDEREAHRARNQERREQAQKAQESNSEPVSTPVDATPPIAATEAAPDVDPGFVNGSMHSGMSSREILSMDPTAVL